MEVREKSELANRLNEELVSGNFLAKTVVPDLSHALIIMLPFRLTVVQKLVV